MNCTLKVARGLNHCWGKLQQVRLLSHRRFEWNYNPDSLSGVHSQLHRFDDGPVASGGLMEPPMASSQRSGPVWEVGRRTILQNPEEHMRRQQLIIEENRRRWTRGPARRDAQAPGISKSDVIYDADDRRNRESSRPRRRAKDPNRAAKDYSKRRRHQRQKEVKRQAYELQKSRRGYNLPRPDDSRAEAQDGDVTMSHRDEAQNQDDYSGASKEWLRKRAEAEEENHWHSWHTCPSQRCSEDLEPGDDFNPSDGSHSGLGRHPGGYYDSRRSFHHLQLPSIRSSNYQKVIDRLTCRRKPVGFHLLMQKHPEDARLEDDSVLEEKPPQAALRKRPENVGKTPRFDMTITRMERAPAPVCSYSEQLTNPPPSGSQSFSNKWRQCASLYRDFKRGA
ncbi:GL11788 [Drosophila persimilis]|uniref:Uncharacterized protein n=2 Tax=pseudoobscura subgroup TaxID=32358 RepID=A0A6I8UWM1_DROPS|nr:uncharacterized protein LOC4805691 [Drosophila pseudoobscura]XP_002026629.1 uncharacterized protein LOC6601626 [Drosophila persimilis]EDW33598.1 GL11788 [Drosophila persimilis]